MPQSKLEALNDSGLTRAIGTLFAAVAQGGGAKGFREELGFSQSDEELREMGKEIRKIKGRNKKDEYGSRSNGNKKGREQQQKRESYMEQKSVLFVEHTKDGELSSRLRDVRVRGKANTATDPRFSALPWPVP